MTNKKVLLQYSKVDGDDIDELYTKVKIYTETHNITEFIMSPNIMILYRRLNKIKIRTLSSLANTLWFE